MGIWQSGKLKIAAVLAVALGLVGLVGTVLPGWSLSAGPAVAQANQLATVQTVPVVPATPSPIPAPIAQPPAIEAVLESGVLIVISKASQRMYVFKDGALWRASPVSTGKRGHATPAGVFPILQKKVFHRSNLYSNAPMPYMQRLTWSGIAIHAGRLPGYPASHGCIRVPREFAKALYGLTRASSTTVVVANERLRTDAHARSLALSTPMPRVPGARVEPIPAVAQATMPPAAPAAPRIAYQPLQPVLAPPTVAPTVAAPAAVQPRPSASQTIQLTAATSPAEAEAHWARLRSAHPDLARFDKVIIPAVVGARRVYRLRASAPDARAFCAALNRAGEDCFNVS